MRTLGGCGAVHARRRFVFGPRRDGVGDGCDSSGSAAAAAAGVGGPVHLPCVQPWCVTRKQNDPSLRMLPPTQRHWVACPRPEWGSTAQRAQQPQPSSLRCAKRTVAEHTVGRKTAGCVAMTLFVINLGKRTIDRDTRRCICRGRKLSPPQGVGARDLPSGLP